MKRIVLSDNDQTNEIDVEMDGVSSKEALFMCCAFAVGVCKSKNGGREWLLNAIDVLWDDEEIGDSVAEANLQ